VSQINFIEPETLSHAFAEGPVMDTYHDPSGTERVEAHTLLPEERFAEVAKLLAQGFLRIIRGHRSEADSAPINESANTYATASYRLDGVRGQSVYATVNHENGG
jgi:hypothetical protein